MFSAGSEVWGEDLALVTAGLAAFYAGDCSLGNKGSSGGRISRAPAGKA